MLARVWPSIISHGRDLVDLLLGQQAADHIVEMTKSLSYFDYLLIIFGFLLTLDFSGVQIVKKLGELTKVIQYSFKEF